MGQEDFEDLCNLVVLVGSDDIARDDVGFRYLIKAGLSLYGRVGQKCEERIKRG